MSWIAIEERFPTIEDGSWIEIWSSGDVNCHISIAFWSFLASIKDRQYADTYTHWRPLSCGPNGEQPIAQTVNKRRE